MLYLHYEAKILLNKRTIFCLLIYIYQTGLNILRSIISLGNNQYEIITNWHFQNLPNISYSNQIKNELAVDNVKTYFYVFDFHFFNT